MAKNAKATTPLLGHDEIALRRWCVEEAIRWPTEGGYANHVATQGGYVPRGDVDVIGRANKLLAWVKGR